MVGMLHRRPHYEDDSALKKPQMSNIISFFDDDLQGVQVSHDDLVVISAIIVNYNVRRILVDNGISTEVLLYDAFLKINLSRDKL